MLQKIKNILIIAILIGLTFAFLGSVAGAYSPNPSSITGECVWWAWERWPQANGPLPKGSDFGMTGDAYQWLWLAQHSGFPTGQTPRVGAVAVWDKWVGGAKDLGHVAFVEQVGSNGQFQVSEYNWSYYHQKDFRWVTWEGGINFIYPKGTTATSPTNEIHEYDRIKGSGPAIFFIERGKKRWIPNTETLLGLNNHFGGDVKLVSESELFNFPDGRQVPDVSWQNSHDNILLKGSASAVYVIKNQQKRLISSMDQFDPDGDFYYPSDIRTVSDLELSKYIVGAPIYNNGDLFVRSGTVYVIEREKRRGIPDPETYTARGYGGKLIYTPPDTWVDKIPIGRHVPNISWANNHDDILLKGVTSALYVMKNNQRHLISSMDQKDIDGDFYYPSDIRIVTDQELVDYQIGVPINNDGDLFRNQAGTVFVIEKGKRRGIPNITTFNQRGYDWNKIYTPPDNWLYQILPGRNIPDANWPDTHDDILLQENASSDVWVMRNGTRWLIPGFDTLAPDGDWYYPSDIRKLPSLQDIPIGKIELPLTLSVNRTYWASRSDYDLHKLSIDYIITNKGKDDASGVTIVGITSTKNVSTINQLPLVVGDIQAGSNKTATLQFTLPPGVTNFRTSFMVTAKDANKVVHSFP